MSSGGPTSASSTRAAEESDLDPAAFLKSVRELSEKREREDTERYRKLEAEIEKARQERAARRADRARSISPEKTNVTAALPKQPTHAPSISPPSTLILCAPSAVIMDAEDPKMSASGAEEIPEFKGFGPLRNSSVGTSAQGLAQTPKPAQSSGQTTASATSLARSGTLSWQQRRPNPRVGGGRPMSMNAADTSTHVRNISKDEPELSRDQIAASLGARDPSWFKQTAERGVRNAAYRKTRDEIPPNDNVVSGMRGLPGMSRAPSVETAMEASPIPSESVMSEATSRLSSLHDSSISTSKFSTGRTSATAKPDLKSLIAADEGQEKASPNPDLTHSNTDEGHAKLGRTLTMSSSQARLADVSDRPASPTKGMGGFVQSAIMKRNDSVSKRWSTQPGSSVSRQNSVVSNQSGYGGLEGSQSPPKVEPTTMSTEASGKTTSRPTSSRGHKDVDHSDTFVKPALPYHSRSKSVASNYSTTAAEGHVSPPSSPSKRWSPTKSSWLESAIAKPDSPKPAAARNTQPSWMTEIAKAKAQRASVDVTPKPTGDDMSGPVSPTKPLFGKNMLKQAGSRDLDPHRAQTSISDEPEPQRSTLEPKANFGQKNPQRSEPPNLNQSSLPSTPTFNLKLADRTDKRVSQPVKEPETAALPAEDFPAKDGSSVGSPSVGNEVVEGKRPQEERHPNTVISSRPTSITKPKPDTPPKPQTDFRANLRSRPPSEIRQQSDPEFLSKIGNLRRTTTQNYVAPDVLKDNIVRGKSDLSKTDGPVKAPKRDELKESLLARKGQWKKDKDEGVVRDRKVSGPPVTPQKPEALAKRELLGRSGSSKTSFTHEIPKPATPEALATHKTLMENLKPDHSLPVLEMQLSPPAETKDKPSSETSRLAARFNPGLAGILARGPPPPSRPDSPATPARSSTPIRRPSDEAATPGAPLEDMRKGRAKGPKRRKGGAKESDYTMSETEIGNPESDKALEATKTSMVREIEPPVEKPKPRALPGSAASVMMSSLQQRKAEFERPSTLSKSSSVASPIPDRHKPQSPVKSAFAVMSTPRPVEKTPSNKPGSVLGNPSDTVIGAEDDIIEFKGFGMMKKPHPTMPLEDDKENAEVDLPVKSAPLMWGRQSPPKKSQPSAHTPLQSQRDEDAAMKSAGLLASSPSQSSSWDGFSISVGKPNRSMETPPTSAGLPPKPIKSSRVVSGQLQEASANAGALSSSKTSKIEIERQLASTFGTVPRSTGPLTIDTHAVITNSPHQERIFRTVRKTVQFVSQDGSLKRLPQPEEYTFFDESVYVCTHAYTVGNGPKRTEIFLWAGDRSSEPALDRAQEVTKTLAKEAGNAFTHTIRQGSELPGFLQALGGILVSRQGSRQNATKQYMLRGRKHLSQIVFDEVEFGASSLCSGFVYLISYPLTLQETRLYLWKGSCCSSDEISAARLAAMDLSETGEVIEVDDGAEFASFLKVFGLGTTKAHIPTPSELWRQKALTPSRFATRLFRIQLMDVKAGLFTSIWTRRPSWNNLSPSRRQENEIKVEAKEISPFSQSDLEADCVYLFDAYSEIYVLIGPVFPSQPEQVCNHLFSQILSFASDYAILAASTEDRPSVPKASVLLSGVPEDLKTLFRHWDEDRGLWGTGGLMAGSSAAHLKEVRSVALDDVVDVVFRSS